MTGGNGMTAADLREIYKVAQVQVTDAEINAQVNKRFDLFKMVDFKSKYHFRFKLLIDLVLDPLLSLTFWMS